MSVLLALISCEYSDTSQYSEHAAKGSSFTLHWALPDKANVLFSLYLCYCTDQAIAWFLNYEVWEIIHACTEKTVFSYNSLLQGRD